MTEQTLDKKTEELVLDIVNCNFCNKELKKDKVWYSPCGLPYCNRYCFDLFTED